MLPIQKTEKTDTNCLIDVQSIVVNTPPPPGPLDALSVSLRSGGYLPPHIGCLRPWAPCCQIGFPRQTAQGHQMMTLGRGCPTVTQLSTFILSQPLSCARQPSGWHRCKVSPISSSVHSNILTATELHLKAPPDSHVCGLTSYIVILVMYLNTQSKSS